jgi:predicted DNA-binding protein (MmcQ/YjbR family)
VTGDEVRAFCLALPEVTEKETWGDAENQGHPTFRVKDKIFVIMATDGSGGSIKTSPAEQGELLAAFPEAARSAAYVGRYGWVDVDFGGLPDEVLREIIQGAWARTAPKRLAAAHGLPR